MKILSIIWLGIKEQLTMKRTLFCIGILVLVASWLDLDNWRDSSVTNETLAIFGFLLLLAFFEEMEEFNFLGLRGKKVEKRLKELNKEMGDSSNESTQPQKDDLTKLKDKDIVLMGVDRGNFLALVFDIERLLRQVAKVFYPDQVDEKTPPSKIVKLLKEHGYLTDVGVKKWEAINEVRNFIVHGRLTVDEDNKLSDWITVAYDLWKEIYDDVVSGQAAK